jgi:hypothetical protein
VLKEKLFGISTAGDKEMFHSPIMNAILASAWGKLDKKIQK